MNASSTRRPRFSRFTLCLLGLAFCVFTWGLQYKLSLYDPPQAASHSSFHSAKLLSRGSSKLPRPRALCCIKSEGAPDKTVWQRSSSILLPLFAILNSLKPPAAFRRNRDAKRPSRQLSQDQFERLLFPSPSRSRLVSYPLESRRTRPSPYLLSLPRVVFLSDMPS